MAPTIAPAGFRMAMNPSAAAAKGTQCGTVCMRGYGPGKWYTAIQASKPAPITAAIAAMPASHHRRPPVSVQSSAALLLLAVFVTLAATRP